MASAMVAAGSLDPQGPVADEIAGLWWLLLVLGSIVYVAFVTSLAVALFRRPAPEADPARSPVASRLARRWIVGAGIVMPVVVLAVVYGATLESTGDTWREPLPDSTAIDVIGHQWFWEVRYPGTEVVTRNELHIPVGSPVEIRLTSADVIHSFWVPELAGKMDALPERTNVLVLEADTAGEHTSVCAEFCGLQHAEMIVRVVAEPRYRFDAWLSAEASA
jgi:cytochrome c oxidase subunit 2